MVAGEQGEASGLGLRHQQPLEWIAMDPGQILDGQAVLGLDGALEESLPQQLPLQPRCSRAASIRKPGLLRAVLIATSHSWLLNQNGWRRSLRAA